MNSLALGRHGPVEPAPLTGEGGGSLAEAYARARSAAAQRHPVRVIVLGDRHRGDDAAAFPAVRSALEGLASAVVDLLDVRETGQLDPADLVELASGGRAIVVDAVIGVPVGEVVVMPLTELAVRAVADCTGTAPNVTTADGAATDKATADATVADGAATPPPAGAIPRSTHVLPVDQLVALAAALRGSPPAGVLVGLGTETFELGQGLSPDVDAALPAFSSAIRTEIERACEELDGPG